jgi:hypothetical protein
LKKAFFISIFLLVLINVHSQTPLPKEESGGIGIMVMTPVDSLFNGLGFSLSVDALVDSVYVSTSLNLLAKNDVWSTIVDLSIGYVFGGFYWAGLYGGLGVGIKFDDDWLTGKINAGVLLGLGYIYMKIDVSYGTILGTTIGIGFGFFASQ